MLPSPIPFGLHRIPPADPLAEVDRPPATHRPASPAPELAAAGVIRWAVMQTDLGALLVAASHRGLCRVAFDEAPAALGTRFPAATIEPADEGRGGRICEWLAAVVACVADPAEVPELPLDLGGTPFQQAVWQALAAVPSGETRSYAELAAMAGKPGAARAAGSACGRNPVALLVPCHRAQRGDGSLGGYAWGLDRKRELLRRERAGAAGRGRGVYSGGPALLL